MHQHEIVQQLYGDSALIEAFLSVRVSAENKEKALRQLVRAALYTGGGEFIELMAGARTLEKLSKEEVYKIYDYKTAYYTFASPLAIGALLAGAGRAEVNRLIRYGMRLGRAFQIKDDILGIFGDEKKIGKSVLTDLREAKKTLLVWHAFRNSGEKNRKTIQAALSKKTAQKKDLARMRRLILESGSLDYAKNEVKNLCRKAQEEISLSRIKPRYKAFLRDYTARVLEI